MSRIGIDFGTTNSAIGRIDADGHPSVQGPFPSLGAWKNGEVKFFGEANKALQNVDDNYHPIRDLKMMLGVEAVTVGRQRLPSLDLSQRMIADLVGAFIQGDIGDVELAVLSTPVKFSQERRSALLEAASLAGLNVVKLVYEPTAALIGALNENEVHDGTSLIVDWGGGTLDIAVVRKTGDTFKELAVSGDVDRLGGSQIDKEIANKLLADNPKIEKTISSREGFYDRFLEEVERNKIDILEDGEEDAELTYMAPSWLGEVVGLDPSLVFSVLRKFAEEAGQQIRLVLKENHIEINSITHVVFAGGVSNSPEVRKQLFDMFPRALEIPTLNPQLITAEGCTALAGTGFDIELAANFSVRQSDDSVCCILPDGMSLATSTYRTAEFWLTDVYAPEAVFEFGVTREGIDKEQSLSMTSINFSALAHLYLPTAAENKKPSGQVPDRIRIYAGIAESLTVTVHAQSLNSKAAKTIFITGVPLSIHRHSKG